MIRNFRHKGLEKYFATGSKSGIRPEHASRLRLLLARLNASRVPRDMNLPGLDLHQLKGELKGFWAVSVSGNWRLFFQFQDGDVINVFYKDYH